MYRAVKNTVTRFFGTAVEESEDSAVLCPLTGDDLSGLRLPLASRFTCEELSEHVLQHPHLAWHVQGTDEYAIGDRWQGRPEIGLVVEVMSRRHRALLVDRLAQSMREAGARLVMLSQEEEGRALGFYRQRGWQSWEEVIMYRRPPGPIPVLPRRLTLLTLTPDRLKALLELEETTFPWLWRYSGSVFQAAASQPNRRLVLAFRDSSLIGYLIYTLHGALGHLDRLAVHPGAQGQGYGTELLVRALDEMGARGAETVGLSTQKSNRRSQRLYEGFGFRRTGQAYNVYGKWIDINDH